MNVISSTPVERALALETLIRQNADQGDRECRLPAEVAEALSANGLYRIGAPLAYGGEEASPQTQIETIETISRFDGSVGWNLMIGIENFGLIAPGCGSCKQMLEDPKVILCSSTAAIGTAVRKGDGYLINGSWQFVSGCQNSSVFAATVRREEGGKVDKAFSYAMIAAPDFEIEETWDASGMRGSGSHDVHVRDLWVPASQMIAPLGGADSDSALMRFPLGPRLSYNKIAIGFGLARSAIDTFVNLASDKVPRFSSMKLRERSGAQVAIAEAEVRIRSSRALVMELLDGIWQKVQERREISLKERAIFHIACSDSARAAAESVELVCEAAGTSVNFKAHPLERIARDVKVIRQHITVARHHLEDGGRVLLGLPPKGVMLKS